MTHPDQTVDRGPLAADALAALAAHAANDHVTIVRLLREALTLPPAQPDRADYLAELAWSYEQLGRFDDAVGAMHEAVAAGLSDEDVSDYPSATAPIADAAIAA